jgi:hypothetical protein
LSGPGGWLFLRQPTGPARLRSTALTASRTNIVGEQIPRRDLTFERPGPGVSAVAMARRCRFGGAGLVGQHDESVGR